VYCPQTDKVYLVPIDDTAGDRETSLRVDPPRNGQRSNIRWAKAYELSALRQQSGVLPLGDARLVAQAGLEPAR
jgi:hypothetical protein